MAWTTKALSNAGLVEGLVRGGLVETDRVQQAMRAVDRGLFSKDAALAYEDCPHPIGYGATISAPHMHATCLEWCVKHTPRAESILDVGSGSGYMVAAFARLYPESRVVGIEIVPELVAWSTSNMDRYDASLRASGRVSLEVGNGWKSLGDRQFDIIHVGAAAERVPDELLRALKTGGIMIIPVGPQGGDQHIWTVTKAEDGRIERTKMLGVRYVPLVRDRQ